jgi:hypothetical protein
MFFEIVQVLPPHNLSQAGETYLQYSVVGWCVQRIFTTPFQNEKLECSPSWGGGQSGVRGEYRVAPYPPVGGL